jgi:hypothetical protein
VTPPPAATPAASPTPAAQTTTAAEGEQKPGPWFDLTRLPSLLVIVLLTGLILYYIRRARTSAGSIFVRKIAGLEAVDDAVGRATEMGKPVLFVPGIGDMSTVSTLAALSILRRVATKVAEYQTRLMVPCTDPIVHPTAQETVKMAYLEAGRADLFSEDDVAYLTYDQFGYVAGVDGIIMRDRPGAIFLQGYFGAEALVLSETGNATGAIQIAGTDQTSQLPFFVAACDYTLIGEELYAAACYLSREPVQLGTLKSQDILKVILVALIVIGTGLTTMAAFLPHGFWEKASNLLLTLTSGAG